MDKEGAFETYTEIDFTIASSVPLYVSTEDISIFKNEI